MITRRRAGLLVVVAGAIAGSAALFGRGGGAPLPGYTIAIEGGRSTATGAIAIGPEDRLRVSLRPAGEVEGEVTARVYALGPGGILGVKAPVEAGPRGAVVVPELRAAMLGEAGSVEVIFVVGRPGALPAEAEIARRMAAGGGAEEGAPYRMLRARVTL